VEYRTSVRLLSYGGHASPLEPFGGQRV